MNILFSTTRQWNPGDEFVLFGILGLLREAGWKFNPVIYNRNPDIRQGGSSLNPLKRVKNAWKGEWLWGGFIRKGHNDNSFKPASSGEFIDSVILAGTPAWYSRELAPLYELIERRRLPAMHIGIGALHGKPEAVIKNERVLKTLADSKAVIVRDRHTQESLRDYNPVLLPCPSLFASRTEKAITDVRKVALIFSTSNSAVDNRLEKSVFEAMVSVYRRLLKHYAGALEFEFVVHYVDELEDIRRVFGAEIPVRYSYDAGDYLRIYESFDLVLGPRIHGIGLAASLGIPGVHLAHDPRRNSAVAEFNAASLSSTEFSDFDRLRQEIEAVRANAPALNLSLIDHKAKAKKTYLDILREVGKGREFQGA